ncbi:MAG: rod shape-determining protein RodA [Candidatus Omnitrophota bacterium]
MNRSGRLFLLVSLLIALTGIISIYSGTFQKQSGVFEGIYLRQALWVAFGAAAFFLVSRMNYRLLWDATYFLYAGMVFLLFLVFIMGIVKLGAQRWLRLGLLSFQPSEAAKLVMVIFLAKYFSDKSADSISPAAQKFGLSRALLIPLAFVIVPAALIIEQPDLGSGMLVLILFMCMLYLSGIKLRYPLSLTAASLFMLPVGWHFLHGYQKERIMVFLNPSIDPLGAGYTIIQSRIAVGSGGLIGKGWLSGTQSQLHFLPESHTDFIFATFAEEWGFAGCLALLLLYYLIIREGIRISSQTGDAFGRLLAAGISIMLFVQVMVNIAMNMGLAPVVGVPLPLMSYGGTSVLVTCISLGILANISRTRAAY